MNPLAEYKQKSKCTWKDLGDACDIYPSQIAYIMKMDASNLGGMTLRTALGIKKGIGVDFGAYYEEISSGT